jgi:hypothetical protein
MSSVDVADIVHQRFNSKQNALAWHYRLVAIVMWTNGEIWQPRMRGDNHATRLLRKAPVQESE